MFHLVDVFCFLINISLHIIHYLSAFFRFNGKSKVFMEVLVGLRSVVFTNHVVLIDDLEETSFHRIEFVL